jgi:hypothetical protein
VLDERAPDEHFRAVLEAAAIDTSELVFDGDGGSQARISIPSAIAPIPTIDDVVVDSTSVTATWHSDPPAASAVFVLNDGSEPPRCHVQGSAAGVLPAPMHIDATSYLDAHAAPITRSTEYGDVVFWYIGRTFQTDVNPV